MKEWHVAFIVLVIGIGALIFRATDPPVVAQRWVYGSLNVIMIVLIFYSRHQQNSKQRDGP